MATKKKNTPKALDVSSLGSQDELLAAITKTQIELVDTRRSHAQKELTNTHRISELKTDIARMKTKLQSLEITSNSSTKTSKKETA